MTTKALFAIEDRIHRQLTKLQDASLEDPELAPAAAELLAAWAAVRGLATRRREREAEQADAGEVLCEIFRPADPSNAASLRRTLITPRRVIRQYGAYSYTDVGDNTRPLHFQYYFAEAMKTAPAKAA